MIMSCFLFTFCDVKNLNVKHAYDCSCVWGTLKVNIGGVKVTLTNVAQRFGHSKSQDFKDFKNSKFHPLSHAHTRVHTRARERENVSGIVRVAAVWSVFHPLWHTYRLFSRLWSKALRMFRPILLSDMVDAPNSSTPSLFLLFSTRARVCA